jgi:hypothetical protein
LLSACHSKPPTASIWSSSETPGTIDQNDRFSDANNRRAVNLGVRFQASGAGAITGIRFYKSANNTGRHVGTLYSDTGTQLAQATFSGETSSGWQQVNFPAVHIHANTTCVASYHTTVGHYSEDDEHFTSAYGKGPLIALENDPGGYGNGCYLYSSHRASRLEPTGRPTAWVDVVSRPLRGTSGWPVRCGTAGPCAPGPKQMTGAD